MRPPPNLVPNPPRQQPNRLRPPAKAPPAPPLPRPRLLPPRHQAQPLKTTIPIESLCPWNAKMVSEQLDMSLLDPIPSPVEHADFAALEWEPLLGLIAGFAASPVGRQAILDLRPSTDEEWITRQHLLTGEVRLALQEQVSIPLGGLFDPTQLAAKAQIPGAALEAGELQAVARLANDVASWQALLESPPAHLVGKLPGLSALSSALVTSLRPLAETIERTIQPDGSLADNASPELGRIRREQERQQRLIEESLRAALRKLSSDGATQEDLITIRGDRFVIPVRAELKRPISGVIHGASSSGQTVFVEPLETIEKNNELVRLIEEEQAEIH